MKQHDHYSSPFVQQQFPIILLLDHVLGPANVGSLFRLADAFNVERIILYGGSVNLGSPRLKKAARATLSRVPSLVTADDIGVISLLREAGYTIIALEITEGSIPLEDLRFRELKKVVLIVGNERQGISGRLLKEADERVYINMFGKNSSMNVSHAAAIALFEITRSLISFDQK